MVLWGRNVADRVLVIAPTHRSSTIILNFTSLHEAGHAELGVFNDEEIPDLFALSVGVERDIDTLAEVAAYVRERPATWEMQEVIEELHRYGALARFGPVVVSVRLSVRAAPHVDVVKLYRLVDVPNAASLLP